MNLEFLKNWRDLEWAGTQYAWLGWVILAAAAWGPCRALWTGAWSLPQGGPGQAAPRQGIWAKLVWLPGTLRVAGLALLWLALLRPQLVSFDTQSSVQALDIF